MRNFKLVGSVISRSSAVQSKRFLQFSFTAISFTLISSIGSWASEQDEDGLVYVRSETCATCHVTEYEAWGQSHHAKAWMAPSPQSIVGDFDNTEYAFDGTLTRFRIEDGIYYATVTEKDGSTTDYPIHSVAGIEPLQQYLLETEPGRLQSFDVVWDVEEAEWYHLYPDQDLPPEDGLHWTGPYKNWNGRCAECHATGFEKNYNPQTRIYASRQAEIGVGCESCHGPGSAHLRWTEGKAISSAAVELDEYGFSMTFGESVEADIQQCAGCHARREAFGEGNPIPGTAFADAYSLALLRPGLYHADGQILDEVYVYGSFLQSKMYAKGVSCGNCHEPHSAQLIAEGNAVCTQCHSPAANIDFPSLRAADYNSPSHHFHQPGTEAAQCKSCHMIERTYMGIDGRRDHSFRIPRPDLSVTLRTPNACTDCHSDEPPSWARDAVSKWYPNGRHTDQHFAQIMGPARQSPKAHIEGLLGIAEYSQLPGIVRASALDLLAQVGTPEIAERTTAMLADPDPLVRTAAVPLQRSAQETVIVSRLSPLLEDPFASVRIAAAREFLGLQTPRLTQETNENLGSSMREWQDAVAAKADFPESQLVIAGMGLTTRQFDAALRAFEEAVTMDPQMIEAWTMIVRIHSAFGNREAARDAVDAAIVANPSDISLKLLRADLQ